MCLTNAILNKERFLLRAKLLCLVVKLRLGFLFKYFPQHKALCSYFAVIPEIPQTERLQNDESCRTNLFSRSLKETSSCV